MSTAAAVAAVVRPVIAKAVHGDTVWIGTTTLATDHAVRAIIVPTATRVDTRSAWSAVSRCAASCTTRERVEGMREAITCIISPASRTLGGDALI
jgi:hypothetical protein